MIGTLISMVDLSDALMYVPLLFGFAWASLIPLIPVAADMLFGGPSSAEKAANNQQSQLSRLQMQAYEKQQREQDYLRSIFKGTLEGGPNEDALRAAMFQFPDSAGGPTGDPEQMLAAMMGASQGDALNNLMSLAGAPAPTNAVSQGFSTASSQQAAREQGIGQSTGNIIEMILKNMMSGQSYNDTDFFDPSTKRTGQRLFR